MYLELRHLRTIRAIHQAGGLARAADLMNMTQSALSHQVAGLEAQVGMELFVRRSKPMTLSAAGIRMLRAAERILPKSRSEEFARCSGQDRAAASPYARLFRLLFPAGTAPPCLAGSGCHSRGLAFDSFRHFCVRGGPGDLVNPEPLPGISSTAV